MVRPALLARLARVVTGRAVLATLRRLARTSRRPAVGRPRRPSTTAQRRARPPRRHVDGPAAAPCGAPGRCATRGASYPHSFVVDSLCCVSRASTFTGQYPHQTGVRINVSSPRRLGRPARWLAGVRRSTATRSGRSPCGCRQAGYTTGYVGKYLNEYDYRPGRKVPPPDPGLGRARRRCSVSAYDGWDFWTPRARRRRHRRRTTTPRRRLGVAAREGRARTPARFIETHRARLHPRARRPGDAPYFLQVAPYAPHGRVHAAGALPRRPDLPAGLPRPAAARGSRTATAAARRAATHAARPARVRRPAGRQPAPAVRTADRADAWNRHPRGLTPRRGGGCMRNRAQMLQSADRMLGASSTRRAGHLRHPHLRQRLPRRPARAARRQGHAVHQRHPGAPARRRPRRARPDARRDGEQPRPGADAGGARRTRAGALPLRAVAAPEPGPSRGSASGTTSSSSTPGAQAVTDDPDVDVAGPALGAIPSYVAARSGTAAGPLRPRPEPGQPLRVGVLRPRPTRASRRATTTGHRWSSVRAVQRPDSASSAAGRRAPTVARGDAVPDDGRSATRHTPRVSRRRDSRRQPSVRRRRGERRVRTRAQGRRLAAAAVAVAVAAAHARCARGRPARPAPGSAAAAAAPRSGPASSSSCSTTSRWTCCAPCAARGRCASAVRRTGTRTSSTRCAACRGRAPSPGSTPTRPACAPTSSETGDADRPRRWLARLPALRQPRALGQRAPAGRGLHDRLRRQVPQRVRVQARRTRPAPPARMGRPPRRLRLGLRRLGLLHLAGRRGPARRRPHPRAARRGERRPSRTRRTPAP